VIAIARDFCGFSTGGLRSDIRLSPACLAQIPDRLRPP
jgi:hypothetical protein